MNKSRSHGVLAAIQKIRAFHELGRQLPPKQPLKETYRQGIIEAEAKKRNVNADTLRKARQFGNRTEGYTRTELAALCRRLREVQTAQDCSGATFEKSHIIRLLSIRSKQERLALQEEAITQGWSTSQLEAMIAQRFGTRRAGGRKRRVPSDEAALLTQLESLCEQWRRWQKSRLQDQITLPKSIEATVEKVSAEIAALQETVSAALKTKQRKRASRVVSSEYAESPPKPAARRPRSRG